MSIWHWRELLPPIAREHELSLGEGNTPLVPSQRLGATAGLSRLMFKLETANPSGSYKDRFAAAAISQMRANSQTACLATSSGNTGSALAAYCAAAAISCQIAIVQTTPNGKLLQMLAHGAQLFRVTGFGIDAEITRRTFQLLESLGQRPESALQISAFKYSPLGMAGVQTISYEIAREMEQVDHVFVPAGGGGLTLAVALGFQRLAEAGRLSRSPKVHCVQPVGNDTIAGPLRAGDQRAREVQCTTAISGLQVPTVIDGDHVISACRATGGCGHTVTDETVYTLQRQLARDEGIFCEPAGAVAVAGALAAKKQGEVHSNDSIVCLITGSGFKDVASIERMNNSSACRAVTLDQLAECLCPGADNRQIS